MEQDDFWGRVLQHSVEQFRSPAPAIPMPMQGIKFGSYLFSEPKPLSNGFDEDRAAVYAILAHDDTWTPRPYRVIYFGETGNLSTRPTRAHEKYGSWCAAAGLVQIHVAVYRTVGSVEARRAIERELIQQYTPVCNEKENPMASLSALLGYQSPSSIPGGLSGLGLFGDPAPRAHGLLSLKSLLDYNKK